MGQPARLEQLGLGALLKDTSTLRAGGRTSNLQVTSQPAQPPELLPPKQHLIEPNDVTLR